ncbi:uncharacterized protein LOC143513863 [Brachyhypopomus gauderio]|uniref:uncharacterized protein LOC143513863 n=1 Tax=Brachyhypopomus gauderio TaxID=698409 RepID=UPI00404215D6
MEHIGLLCLLLCGIIHTTHTETLHVRVIERNIGTLHCGKLTKSTVTWSRDIDGQRVDILTNYYGQITKHIPDPHKRYSSGKNPVLCIFRVSQSDSGRYYCNETTVELNVIPRSVKSGTSTEGEREDFQPGIWKVVVSIIAGSFLVTVASVLLIWRYYYKRTLKMTGQSGAVALYAEIQTSRE